MSDDLHIRPTSNEADEWRAYWQTQGMPWRTEPEIDEVRQHYLAERRVVTPDIERGLYPFRDANGSIKLTRGDVEWLLATHESGGMRGPVDWDDARQREREGIDLRGADLRKADLYSLPLARMRGGFSRKEWVEPHNSPKKTEMAAIHLEGADLRYTHVEEADLRKAHFEGADVFRAHVEMADLYRAHFEAASVHSAHLDGANLRHAHLEGTDLRFSHLSGKTTLDNHGTQVVLPAADLRSTFLSVGTTLDGIALGDRHTSVMVADVHWNAVDLTVVDWSSLMPLGDERNAREPRDRSGKPKEHSTRTDESVTAVRANRQLATALRSQGLHEDADRFAYRAQLCQRRLLRLQRQWLRYLGSLFLGLIAGYGYRPLRSFIAYAVVILGFMGLYLLNSHFVAPHLTWNEALVLSMSSFHGRGFFSPNISLGDTYAQLAAAEAFIGLMIEITFIATFTQRFFVR